jgi:hypothetical protein
MADHAGYSRVLAATVVDEDDSPLLKVVGGGASKYFTINPFRCVRAGPRY